MNTSDDSVAPQAGAPDTLTLSVINRFAPSFDLVEQPVPEPATLGALFVGIAGLRLARAMSRRTRR